MAYIYKITNDINQKIYIGKTERSLQERFAEHKRNYTKPECENRPLYRAMKKYGLEHFYIESIEQTDNPEEREIYWIEYYGSFKNGYNATIGGDGRKYLDYDLIIVTYKEVQNCMEVARILNINEKTVRNVLHTKNIPVMSHAQTMQQTYGQSVAMIDKTTNQILNTFPSYSQAGQYLIDNQLSNCRLNTIRTHISEVTRGKRKSAAGYKWKIL